jgi:hypothetical protein
MKKILLIIPIAFATISGFGQKKFTDLVGHWEIVDQNTHASLDIVDSSNIILSYNGEKKTITDLKIDFQKVPVWFDFSTEDSSSSIVMIKSLIETVNENLIKWQLFIDEDRTDHFSSTKGELFYLRKVKPIVTTAIVSH